MQFYLPPPAPSQGNADGSAELSLSLSLCHCATVPGERDMQFICRHLRPVRGMKMAAEKCDEHAGSKGRRWALPFSGTRSVPSSGTKWVPFSGGGPFSRGVPFSGGAHSVPNSGVSTVSAAPVSEDPPPLPLLLLQKRTGAVPASSRQ